VHNAAAPANGTNVQNAFHLAARHKTAPTNSKEMVVSVAGSINSIMTLTATLQM
jgi:hypothetical protein